ncbi:MAG: nucleoside hydrolase-like domain-containing protein [Bacteroidota bacterium]
MNLSPNFVRKSFLLYRWQMLVMVAVLAHSSIAQVSPSAVKPRIIVTADPELDDNNSLIRFLLYSTDLDIEGLVYASSQFHWKGDGKGTKWYVPGREYDRFQMGLCPCESWRWAEDERFIHDIVDAYEEVYANLIAHHADYPKPEYLRSTIRYGNIAFDGDISTDSPGSELIKSVILDDEPGRLYITAWGGQSTIARALKSIQEQYQYTTQWETIRSKVVRKVVLLPNGDQDDTYANYIRPHWPDIEYRQFTDSPRYGYAAQLHASEDNAPYLTAKWMKENVTDRGPLGDLYRVWGDGKQMVEGDRVDYFGLSGYTSEELKEMGYYVWLPVHPAGSFLSEGDNSTFMNMLGNGLRAFERGFYGGWGGRVTSRDNSNPFGFGSEGTADEVAASIGSQSEPTSESEREFPDFFRAAQRDFANRMKWSVTDEYGEGNHEPLVQVQGPLTVQATPGQNIALFGAAEDPDGDDLTVRWWQLHVGTYPGTVAFTETDAGQVRVSIPEDAQPGQTIHMILEATDDGAPALTRYQRVVIVLRGK